ncbi:TPA: hypothetical protein ACNEJR_004684 [Escherichia coli]
MNDLLKALDAVEALHRPEKVAQTGWERILQAVKWPAEYAEAHVSDDDKRLLILRALNGDKKPEALEIRQQMQRNPRLHNLIFCEMKR